MCYSLVIMPLQRIENDALGPIVAHLGAEGTIGQEENRAVTLVRDARARAAELTAQADVVERVYQGEFLADARTANQLATAIASGDVDVEFDVQSLGEHGDDPDKVRNYLSAFVVQDPSRSDYPFSRLTFPATAVIPHNGKEHHVDRYSPLHPLTPYSFSPSFNPDITVPTLVDPQIRTFAELEELEAIDPGHAQQLLQAYSMAAREQKDTNPLARFEDPLIIRMVTILPTGYDYKTDFVPQVELPKGRGTQAWDPRLLVGGALNASGNYLGNRDGLERNRVVLNRAGKETALRVSRPLPEEVTAERAQALMPLADHEMNRMAVFLFPYQVKKQARVDISPFVDSSAYMFGGGMKGTTRGGGNVGGALIGDGVSGILGAGKREKNIFGDRIIPEIGGRPVIYSIRLLTAQRPPDTIAA